MDHLDSDHLEIFRLAVRRVDLLFEVDGRAAGLISDLQPQAFGKSCATWRFVISRPLPTTKPVPPYGTSEESGNSTRPIEGNRREIRSFTSVVFRLSQG
jgi:hypothetical protein